MENKGNQAKTLEVRCVECRQYAYHDPEKYGAVIAGLDIEPEYRCSGCVNKGKGFSCCDELARLRQRTKDLEAMLITFAQDAAK